MSSRRASRAYKLAARELYTGYKADIRAYVMVMQSRELCQRLDRAENRIAELQMLRASK
jgi:CRP/FNR family transcriptional regulator, cyclic AMP receptor protein